MDNAQPAGTSIPLQTRRELLSSFTVWIVAAILTLLAFVINDLWHRVAGLILAAFCGVYGYALYLLAGTRTHVIVETDFLTFQGRALGRFSGPARIPVKSIQGVWISPGGHSIIVAYFDDTESPERPIRRLMNLQIQPAQVPVALETLRRIGLPVVEMKMARSD